MVTFGKQHMVILNLSPSKRYYKIKRYLNLYLDGTVLCKLINKIWPNSIIKIHPNNSYKYKLLDNITTFLKVALAKGLDPNDTFYASDLFEVIFLINFSFFYPQ